MLLEQSQMIQVDNELQLTGEYILHQFFAGIDSGYIPIAAIILTESGDVELRGTLPEGSAMARLAERVRDMYAGMVG